MKLNSYQRIFSIYFIAIVLFWILLFCSHTQTSVFNYLYSLCFSLIPLVGGFIAIVKSRDWGGVQSYVGKAVFFIGLGLLLWGMGSMVWSYYNLVAKIEMPYPSIADFGFAPSIFFYGLGTFYLSKATGAKYGLRSKKAKVFAVLSPLVILIASYYVLVVVARGGILIPAGESLLKAILDIAYPLGDFVSLTVAIIVSGLSFRFLGGKYKRDIILLFIGLGVMYLADFVFSYTTTVGIFYNGDFGDLMLTIGLFLLALGILGFTKPKEEFL